MRDDKQPICTYGGYTCAESYQSSYGFCTLQHMPLDPGGMCRFCIEVKDGSSLNFMNQGMPALVPDSDHLDLTGAFTIFAFVKKTAEQGNSGASREYIVTKQSDYSGKGYWIALIPTGAIGEYDMEFGVYVGSEKFRTARQTVNVPVDEWLHIGVTYSGTALTMYADQVMVSTLMFDDEPPMYNRRNSQPLLVGKDFAGLIDNLLMFDSVRVSDDFVSDSMCPHNLPANNDGGLIAYFRFNEAEGFMTRDASPHGAGGTFGYLGLVCANAPEGNMAMLQCAPGHTISEVLYANFGENDGTCGAYEAGPCALDRQLVEEFVGAACLNHNNCSIPATVSTFNTTLACRATTRTLAINAICKPALSAWSMHTAPTLVGETHLFTDDLFCPFELMDQKIGFEGDDNALPDWLDQTLEDLMMNDAQCGGADTLDSAQTGRPVVFGLRAKDGCGYRSLTSTADDFDATVTYPMIFNVSAMEELETCPDFPQTRFPNISIAVHNGNLEGEEPAYCSSWSDVFVFSYTPTFFGEPLMSISYESGSSDAEKTLIDNVRVAVDTAPISSATTKVIGSVVDADDVHVVCEAGVESRFQVVAYDESGNRIMKHGDADKLAVNVMETPSAGYHIENATEPGVYDVFIIFATSGTFTLQVTLLNSTIYEGTVTCSGSMIRMMDQLNIDFPEARFEHTVVSYNDDLYVFGGAKSDKTYLDATLKFDLDIEESSMYYSFKRMVMVDSMPEEVFNVELHLDTEMLISSGKLKEDCSDLRFFTWEGDSTLPMWVEPSQAPAGCGSSSTSVWIRVPGGMERFWMYYGNKQATSMSDAVSVFGDMFEDFEYSESPLDNGWTLENATSDSCTPDAGYNPGEAASFYTSDLVSMTGTRSLRANIADFLGGSLEKAVPMMKRFTMKVFMYDLKCEGAHFVSPDFKVCQPLDLIESSAQHKSLLPNLDNGVGVYTSSDNETYCVMYPWHSSTAKREHGWHSFTLQDDDERLTITYDDVMVLPLRADDVTTDVSKIFLRAARLPEQEHSSVFWDSILVTEYIPGLAASYMEEQHVVFSREAKWETVGIQDPPPARQAHTAVVYGDSMYIFGGEQSTYEYSDVWRYDFGDDLWEFQPAINGFDTLGRHDHSAVVYNNTMYVYGGRSPAALGDFWAYDFDRSSWRPMPVSEGMMGRYGHSAAVTGGKMYVYGGYVSKEQSREGELTDEIWAFDFAHMEWLKVGPRYDNFAQDWIEDPTDAILFPQAIPLPRFAMTAVITGMEPALYAVGGAGGGSMMEEQPDIWKFDIQAKEWKWMGSSSLLARYDSAGALVANGTLLVMYGGHAQGRFMGDVIVIYVGESGLGSGDMLRAGLVAP
mmetsp:Transcript_43186/g.80925  ORF Transcript_43186/g.80925 Transcript_43186/m.80925 type:complete len:1349 (-) Transcript_43186:490-4536(-)